MHHSILGKIVLDEMYETMVIRPGVYIDEIAVMSDHVHVLFAFDCNVTVNVETALRAVSTKTRSYIHFPSILFADSLGSIVGQIKSKTTRRIRKIIPEFSWQGRFHDRVVRFSELDHIRKYIRNNSRYHA
ncbi:hypothetical protein EBT31_03160 [bacterium]|nr:hypothetical protein [bacterium]NBX49874.1 hypothetical protein [bacterium]